MERINSKKISQLLRIIKEKKDLVECVEWNYETLIPHNLICTGTTGKLVEQTLIKIMKELGKSTVVKLNV